LWSKGGFKSERSTRKLAATLRPRRGRRRYVTETDRIARSVYHGIQMAQRSVTVRIVA
jgi:hypothetical protein